ncbi:hypothetical protein SPHINGO8BC_90225 [Sphingobacterium multivorum]|uniref:Uncharacterized protein n=1 Tax=Sphingobacterium multivorum TaxID=28454 RepID=A0A654DS77_SPHMU|nr:hypothetical protein SPHINGO8BC_90225 [Sphingobacterium multivorum]
MYFVTLFLEMKQSRASREKVIYSYMIYSDKATVCPFLLRTLPASINKLYPFNFNHIHI